jgi:hypothetical protein
MYIRRIFCVDYSSYSPHATTIFAVEDAVNVEDNHRIAGSRPFFSTDCGSSGTTVAGADFLNLLSLNLSS